MPTQDDVIGLYQALSNNDLESARSLASSFGPGVQSGIETDPGRVLSTIEALADRKGIALPLARFTGGATRTWEPETAGRLGAFTQGIQRGMFAGGSPLGLGPVPGAAPVTGLAENVLQALGMATPMAASYLTGGLAAAPLAARAGAATGPGILAALTRGLGPGFIRSLLGSIGFEGTGLAAGVREPREALENVGWETALFGPGASLARAAIPGAGGAVRRSFATRRALQDLYSGLTPAQAKGTLAQRAARNITAGRPVQGVGGVGPGATPAQPATAIPGPAGAQAGSITQQGSQAIDAELAKVRGLNAGLSAETTKAARKTGTEIVPKRQRIRSYGPEGEFTGAKEIITEPYESQARTAAKPARAKLPARKKSTSGAKTPPKRKRAGAKP